MATMMPVNIQDGGQDAASDEKISKTKKFLMKL